MPFDTRCPRGGGRHVQEAIQLHPHCHSCRQQGGAWSHVDQVPITMQKYTLKHQKTNGNINLQVAALAPLALLLVLEARCAHFVIVHFKNLFVL